MREQISMSVDSLLRSTQQGERDDRARRICSLSSQFFLFQITPFLCPSFDQFDDDLRQVFRNSMDVRKFLENGVTRAHSDIQT